MRKKKNEEKQSLWKILKINIIHVLVVFLYKYKDINISKYSKKIILPSTLSINDKQIFCKTC